LIGPILGFLVYLIAMGGGLLLVSTLPLVFLSALLDRHAQGARAALVVSTTMMLGFLVGGILSWNLIAFYWDMPLWTTLKASVDAETYGHPVEHRAEVILIWVLFFSVLSALVVGVVEVVAAKLRKRLQHS